MFFKSANNDGAPPTETEQGNKILLLMFAALALLIFMDNQARRHYRDLGVRPAAGKKAVRASRKKIDEIRERVLPPMRKSAADIFGSDLPNPGGSPALMIPSPGLSGGNGPGTRTVPAGPRVMQLYFIRFRGGRSVLVRVKRTVPAGDYTPLAALRLLQKGTLPSERGLMSVLRREFLILGLKVENGTALVELGDGFARNAPRLIRDRIDQVKFTLLQFKEIKRIRFSLQGRTLSDIRGVPVKPRRPRRVLSHRPGNS